MQFVRTDGDLNPKIDVEKRTGKGTTDVHMVTDAAWIQNAAKSGQYSVDLWGLTSTVRPITKLSKNVINDKFFLTSAAVFAMGWNTKAVPGSKTPPRCSATSTQGRSASRTHRHRGLRGLLPLLREELRPQLP